ncbi:hypothetical protein [Clostridium sp. ZS2-4]|uniref:hypothetical protein n=1 Tax=Clostridium sp. ZS2-4 TaxID=2987703 RepID=UPI00227B0F6F|nr:hypothetical protein [Clostridium sp. ZS2-4]MCY6354197.1 hypothetical protein [Clostridium sp. ZS2-4]
MDESKCRFYYADDTNKMTNILIYHLISLKDQKRTIIVPDTFKQEVQRRLLSRKLLLDKRISILEVTEYIENNHYTDVAILMYYNLLKDIRRVIKNVNAKQCLLIGPQIKDCDIYNNDDNNYKFINETEKLIRYRDKWNDKYIIKSEKIIEWLIDTIKISKQHIYLECPWFNNDAFDKFKKVIKAALIRNVEVKIFYGINKETDSRHLKTIHLINDLRIENSNYSNFEVIEKNTHIKQALIDNWYLHASHNFGSNTLKYENSPDENAVIDIVDLKKMKYIIDTQFREEQHDLHNTK